MAARKGAALEVVKDRAEETLATEPEAPGAEATAPYNLEPLNDRTKAIVIAWGRGTQNRIGELQMSGAPEWARFLSDIFSTVGAFVEEG